MPGVLKVTIKPIFRDLRGRFVKAEKALLDEKRQRMRYLGQRYVAIAREEAPERMGKFKKSIIYRTFERGDTVQLKTYAMQPLFKFIVRGTDPHPIRARAGGVLRFSWPRGPKGPGTYFFRSVQHPGTQPNPYNERAYARWKPEARPELRKMALRYVAVIQG